MNYLTYIIVFAAIIILYFVVDTVITFRKKTKRTAQQKKSKFYTTRENFQMLYEDLPERGSLSMWLSDDTLLHGRPDLVLKDRLTGEVVVVDYKSGAKKTPMPFEYQVQLSAYFLLVESEFNIKPARGIIRYLEDNSEDVIENDPYFASQITTEALELAKTKREMEEENKDFSLPRSHNDATRCAVCSYKRYCPEKI